MAWLRLVKVKNSEFGRDVSHAPLSGRVLPLLFRKDMVPTIQERHKKL